MDSTTVSMIKDIAHDLGMRGSTAWGLWIASELLGKLIWASVITYGISRLTHLVRWRSIDNAQWQRLREAIGSSYYLNDGEVDRAIAAIRKAGKS